jgi:ParB family chromosome partitioning protein
MSLKDKAGGLDFSTFGAGLGRRRDSGPKTAPGQLLSEVNDRRSALLQEMDELKAKWDGALPVKRLDPLTIRPSRFANRHESSFESEDFQVLKAEISAAGGNIQPIKVRPVPKSDGDRVAFEVVFGHRRHRACQELRLPVLALVEDLDTLSLFEQMERENRARAGLTAWESGVTWKRALDAGLYPSQRQMASALGVDLSQMGKAIRIAELPAVVIAALGGQSKVRFSDSAALDEAYRKDPDGLVMRAKKVLDRAEAGEAISFSQALLFLVGGSSVKKKEPEVVHLTLRGRSASFSQADNALMLRIDTRGGFDAESFLRHIEAFDKG